MQFITEVVDSILQKSTQNYLSKCYLLLHCYYLDVQIYQDPKTVLFTKY